MLRCCVWLMACIFLLETCCNEALLLGPGSVRLCCVWQWRGRFSRFWRPLHPGAGIPCWPRLGHRKGKNMHVHISEIPEASPSGISARFLDCGTGPSGVTVVL